MRTSLGWCIIGPIDMKDGKTIPCNWITVTEAGKGGTSRHHFVIEDKCQEVGTQEMLMKLYMQDFVQKLQKMKFVMHSRNFHMKTKNLSR